MHNPPLTSGHSTFRVSKFVVTCHTFGRLLRGSHHFPAKKAVVLLSLIDCVFRTCLKIEKGAKREKMQLIRLCPIKSQIEELLVALNTSIEVGLTPTSVANLQRVHGMNALEGEEKEHIVLRYIGQFKDPLILLLLGSAVLSVCVGQYEDAMSIAAAVVIVGSVAFYQEYQSEQSLEALNDLVPPRCNALRDGKMLNILAEDLVPGDIIRLQSGDRIPADARVIQSTDLSIDESSLTGEQEPREKTSAALPDITDESEISSRINMVFMGTLVSSGHSLAVVTATALSTEFGKTFQEMKDIENRRTPLQIKMDELGKKLSVFSFGIIGCIGALGMFQGKDFMSMFNIGVSLAVAAIPEGLPICVTVTLGNTYSITPSFSLHIPYIYSSSIYTSYNTLN